MITKLACSKLAGHPEPELLEADLFKLSLQVSHMYVKEYLRRERWSCCPTAAPLSVLSLSCCQGLAQAAEGKEAGAIAIGGHLSINPSMMNSSCASYKVVRCI